MHRSQLPPAILNLLRQGSVIPAHPLALDAGRRFDPRRQRALSRYYLDAGSGGLAVGVHTTQFAIRDVGLYEPVLETAARTAADWATRPTVMIAGVWRYAPPRRSPRRNSQPGLATTPDCSASARCARQMPMR